jgi:hypothetical protein
VEVAAPVPAQDGTLIGVFRDLDARDVRLYAIPIALDTTTALWRAGDGSGPLEAFEPDPSTLGNPRIDLRQRR